jgi:6-phosphogluconolactonase (cycloisomerase 2 family)
MPYSGQVDTLLALHRLPQHEEAPQALLQHPGGFFNMGKIRIRPFITAIFLAVPLLGALFALSPVSSAFAAGTSSAAGHVYVLDNATNGNAISAFNRAAGGTLTSAGTTAIGGQGSGGGLGSQGSLIFSPDRSWLFAVDAGSNQISVIGVDAHGTLHPASVSSSGGVDPISLTATGNFLYVVNSGDSSHAANVTGFRVSGDGSLHPIAGSTQPLSAANPGPAQVQADPTGAIVIVTEKNTNLIDSYHIGSDGSLSQPTFTPSTGTEPFGFAFNPATPSQFVVSDASAGAVTSYGLHNGNVTLEDGPVADNQAAPCWVVITGNGSFAYTANAGSSSISGYSLSPTGTLALLASTGAGKGPNEIVLTSDSHFLYALDRGAATLSGFQVQSNGSLVSVSLGGITLPSSLTGLAAD